VGLAVAGFVMNVAHWVRREECGQEAMQTKQTVGGESTKKFLTNYVTLLLPQEGNSTRRNR
jgi:hypothetical protein